MERYAQAADSGAFRRRRLALWSAALCALGFIGSWLVLAHVPAARVHDAAALRGFISLDHGHVEALANATLALVTPLSCTLFTLAAMAVAWRRGRRALLVAVPVVIVGATASAEALKPILAVAHDYVDAQHQIPGASWPSGHSTAVMSMTLCALLVAPRRWRPAVAAIGGVFTVAVGFSLLTLAWHLPSDVIGGYLLAAVWGAGAVAVLSRDAAEAVDATRPAALARVAHRRPAIAPRRDRGGTLVPGVVLGSLAAFTGALVALRPTEVAGFAATHHSVIAFAAIIAALAASLVSGFTVALRR